MSGSHLYDNLTEPCSFYWANTYGEEANLLTVKSIRVSHNNSHVFVETVKLQPILFLNSPYSLLSRLAVLVKPSPFTVLK